MKFTAIATSSGKLHTGTLGSVTAKIYEHARPVSRPGKRPGTRTVFQVVDNTLGHRPVKRESYMSKDTGLIDIAGMNHDFMAAMGLDFAQAFKKGNSKFFREWADAVDAWNNHKPQADKLRLAIITFCIPPTGIFKMRDIISHLRAERLIPESMKESVGLADVRRNVRRICKELGIRIKGERGRPKK